MLLGTLRPPSQRNISRSQNSKRPSESSFNSLLIKLRRDNISLILNNLPRKSGPRCYLILAD